MNLPFTSCMFLSFAPSRQHVMDEIVSFSGRGERHALKVLQPGFPHDVPPLEVPTKPAPVKPIDVPTQSPQDVPPYEPKDVPPPEPDKIPQPKPTRQKANGQFR